MMQVIVAMVSPYSWSMGGLLGTRPARVTSEVQKTDPWTHFLGFVSVNPPRGGFSSWPFYGDCRYNRTAGLAWGVKFPGKAEMWSVWIVGGGGGERGLSL